MLTELAIMMLSNYKQLPVTTLVAGGSLQLSGKLILGPVLAAVATSI